MKIAILNLGNNIQGFKTTPASETIYLSECLKDMGLDVDLISMKNTQYGIAFDDVPDPNVYDRVLVVNASLNFYGGEENKMNKAAYMFLNKYKSKIYYLFTDIRLPWEQAWRRMSKKKWSSKYTEEQFIVRSPIRVVSQGRDLEQAKRIHSDRLVGVSKDRMEFVHFALDRHKMYHSVFKIAADGIKMRDLIYGGTFRSGNREAKMVEYLFDTGLDVEFFGSVKADQFKNPEFPWTTPPVFPGKVDSREMVQRNSTAYATIVLGDKTYDNNQITPRVWEALASTAVAFFDSTFDPDMNIMEGNEFFYVSNRQELVEKINKIKNDEDFRIETLEYQHKILQKYLDEKPIWQAEFKKAIEI
ncbi:DNA beta-glucosyltransferase [Enterobacter phage KKP_3262]|nr:DNA beta-glucosyltransferase [Enterobacter phage KKP_3262]